MGKRGPIDLRPKVRPMACMLAELSISDLVRAKRREHLLLSSKDDVGTGFDLEQLVVVVVIFRRLLHLRSLITGAVAGALGGSCFSRRLSAVLDE